MTKRHMKRVAALLLLLLMLTGAFTAAPVSSDECFLDMSGAVGIFGFDGTTNTLFISNMRFSNRSFTYSWKLNLFNGSWEIVGVGGAASGRGGLIDFSSAAVEFSGCVDMVIRNFRVIGQSFTACWRLDTFSGDWTFGSLGDTCGGGGQPGPQTSHVTVSVSDATRLFNPPISGATVVLRPSSGSPFTGTTDVHGVVEFSNVPYGTYTLEVSAQGFTTSSSSRSVSSPTENFLVALSTVLATGQYRIVLTWGARPTDLDSHLLVPADSAHPGGFHVYYVNASNATHGLNTNPLDPSRYPLVTLDVDDWEDGYGPETITIAQAISGTYRYYVHNYAQEWYPEEANSGLPQSQAVVTLYRGSTQLKTWNVPTSGTGHYWHVFDLDAANQQITDGPGIVSSAPTP